MTPLPCATSETWYWLESGPGGSALNMAVDEALLMTVGDLGKPVLRFYGWSEPAATFGYFQKYQDVAAMTRLRPLLRRPTGGGLVPHDADWTYSLVFPPGHWWFELRAPESYRRLHDWLRKAFGALGRATRLAPARHVEAPGQCFAGAEPSDLLWQDRKIAGAAQRRNRQGLLIQGSVQPPAGHPRALWEEALKAVATREWAVTWDRFPSRGEWTAHAEALAASKYARPDYNERR